MNDTALVGRSDHQRFSPEFLAQYNRSVVETARLRERLMVFIEMIRSRDVPIGRSLNGRVASPLKIKREF
jgi:hypothetical protein